MHKVLVRLKILPIDAYISLTKVLESLKKILPSNIDIKRSVEEPIAFGLVASVIDFIIEEREGEMENLEKLVKSSDLVSEIEIIGVSKYSTTLNQ